MNNSLQDGSEEDHRTSHGLNTTCFFLWGFVKDQVHRTTVCDFADLQERIYAAVNNVTPRCFISHRSNLNSGWTFPMPLMKAKLKFMNIRYNAIVGVVAVLSQETFKNR